MKIAKITADILEVTGMSQLQLEVLGPHTMFHMLRTWPRMKGELQKLPRLLSQTLKTF